MNTPLPISAPSANALRKGTSITLEQVTQTFALRSQATPGPSSGAQHFTALQNVNLHIEAGEFLVIVGPSGCGKSTLLDLVGGLAKPTTGRVLLDGKPIQGPGLDRGIVFQQYALMPWLTTRANVEFGLQAMAGLSRAERQERSAHYIELVGLKGFENHYPHQLSGGMKQRVAIARSLAYEPGVLLMDEPFAALDAQTREQLQDELLRIWRATGRTILFITHGIDEAVYLGQRVAVMSSRPGRIEQIVTIQTPSHEAGADARASAEFVRDRHHIWELLHGKPHASALAPTSATAAA